MALLALAIVYCMLNIIIGLRIGRMYPFGPFWLAVPRSTRPLGFWLSVGMFAILAGFLLAGAVGVVPGFSTS
jgi:hypothetical protein